MRYRETIVFDDVIEVRSQPLWIKALEFWFVWVHEFWSHKVGLRLPEDPYWGEPFEAGFHRFYTWTLNYDVRIESTERR